MTKENFSIAGTGTLRRGMRMSNLLRSRNMLRSMLALSALLTLSAFAAGLEKDDGIMPYTPYHVSGPEKGSKA